MKVAFVSCVKTKQPGTHPAKELYSSPLFRLSFEYTSKHHADRTYILSAKYGLVEPERRIESYEQTLKNMSAAARREWAEKVAKQIRETVPRGSTLLFFCGDDYRRDLIPRLTDFEYEVPLQGLSFGRQLQWYKHHQE